MAFLSRTNVVTTYNLIPFKSIIDIFNNSSLYWIIINILGNICVFIPLNYFLIELCNIKKKRLLFIYSLLIVLVFELIQLTFKLGVFDIDDIILCTFGMNIFSSIYLKIKGEKYEK